MNRNQPEETRRQFLSRFGALVAGLAGIPLVPPAVASGPDPADALNLGLERAFVLFELRLFEQHYLPALHAPFSQEHRDGVPRLTFCDNKERRLERWQAATRRLAEALKAPPHPDMPTLNLDEFRPLFANWFMLEFPARRCFSVRQGRICWHIFPLGSIRPEPEHRACDALHLLRGCFALSLPTAPEAANACEQLRSLLPQIKKLYRQLDPLSADHFTAYEWLLPLLAEVDPAWAVQVLDRSRMQHEVRTDRHLSPAERDLRLGQLNCPFVSSYLSSAIAFVMGSLANNHFCKIDNLFGHPEIFGIANSLMTEIVFAVLYRKVEVLQGLSREVC